MRRVTELTSLKEMAVIVCTTLSDHGMKAVLSGGAVVSIYTQNAYESLDLDFLVHASMKTIDAALETIGFRRTTGRHYHHPSSAIIVEFPTPPLAIGNKPIRTFNEITSENGTLRLLTPTHCVMDRLAAYYYWNDYQSFEQALMVARDHPVIYTEIETWSKDEGMTEKLMKFLHAVQTARSER